mmetsp:Transcript_91671/g.144964  ORF Transcript_91671/g.144964 Transcript_91671/m.144964 type:complete len:133 (-) Transcript_91671:433-831(-)
MRVLFDISPSPAVLATHPRAHSEKEEKVERNRVNEHCHGAEFLGHERRHEEASRQEQKHEEGQKRHKGHEAEVKLNTYASDILRPQRSIIEREEGIARCRVVMNLRPSSVRKRLFQHLRTTRRQKCQEAEPY